MKVIVTNTETNEQAIITDMYLWFLLWEQMKAYKTDVDVYRVELVQG